MQLTTVLAVTSITYNATNVNSNVMQAALAYFTQNANIIQPLRYISS